MQKGSATGKILGIIAIVIIAIIVIIFAVSRADKAKAPAQNSGSNDSGQTTTDSATEWKNIKSYTDADLTLYIGQGCPHCKVIEDYILNNKVDQALKLNIKEIWYNKANASDLTAKAEVCKIASDQVGVPMLFQTSTSKCYVGGQPVIDFLKTLQPAQ